MMNAWSILGRLRQITALDEEGAAIALPLCESAAVEISRKLKSNTDQENPRILAAAAGLAFYKLATYLACSEGNISSRKVGDIAITQNNNALLEMAKNVRDEAFAQISDLLVDDGFLFRKVGL